MTGLFQAFTMTMADQLSNMAVWPNPITYVVVEPVLYRRDKRGLKFLIARRMKGALSKATEEKGEQPAKISLHPGGGFVIPNQDDDPAGAVQRALNFKLGYDVPVNAITFIGTAGPALNFSSLRKEGDKISVVIRDEPAEPKIAFVAMIHAVDMSVVKKVGKGNDSLEELGFFTPEEIAERFGEECIYPTFLKLANDVLCGEKLPGRTALWRPGRYLF